MWGTLPAKTLTRTRNRWTRAAGARVLNFFIRRCLNEFAPPRQLNRSAACTVYREDQMAETFEAYRNRILSYLGDEEPIGVQQATPSQLERRLREVAPGELIRRP